MKRLRFGTFLDARLITGSPRFYFRIGGLVLMWWPHEGWRRKLEVRWQ
jgi:hypothetical protein